MIYHNNDFYIYIGTLVLIYYVSHIYVYTVVCYVSYPPTHRFGRNAKIIHFIGPVKPWQHRYLPEMDSVILYPGTYSSQHAALDFIKRWWQVYTSVDATAEQVHLFHVCVLQDLPTTSIT